MANLDPSLLSFRSGTLLEDMGDIFKRNIEYTYLSLKGCGLVIQLVGIILVGALSLLEMLVYAVEYAQKPKAPAHCCNRLLSLRTDVPWEYNENEYYVNGAIMYFREVQSLNKNSYSKGTKTQKKRTESIMALRNHLYANDLTLHGKILKVINHKISHKDLEKLTSGENIGHTLTTTHITFGSSTLDKLIKDVLSEQVSLRKKRNTGETYLVAKNDDYGFIQICLERIYREPIRVIFDEE